MRKRKEYSNTNANLFFALLTHFFIQSHSLVKFNCLTGLYHRRIRIAIVKIKIPMEPCIHDSIGRWPARGWRIYTNENRDPAMGFLK